VSSNVLSDERLGLGKKRRSSRRLARAGAGTSLGTRKTLALSRERLGGPTERLPIRCVYESVH